MHPTRPRRRVTRGRQRWRWTQRSRWNKTEKLSKRISSKMKWRHHLEMKLKVSQMINKKTYKISKRIS